MIARQPALPCEFTLPGLKTDANAVSHYANRFARMGAAEKQRAQTAGGCIAYGAKATGLPCGEAEQALARVARRRGLLITMTRVSPSSIYPDAQNIPGALKHVIDGFASWLGLDDRDPGLFWAFRAERTKRGAVDRWAVRIRLEMVPPGQPRVVVLDPAVRP